MSLLLRAFLAAGLVAAYSQVEPACHKEHFHHRIVHAGSRCAGALRAPKVAMLFLTRGEMPHEQLWRRWFGELDSVAFRGCMQNSSADQFVECALELELRHIDPIARQHLFSVRHQLLHRLHVMFGSLWLRHLVTGSVEQVAMRSKQ